LSKDLPIVLLSVTEGEDKPLKYPSIFQSADAAILTRMDLAQAVFGVSAKTGTGVAELIDWFCARS
jgi:Ni2+-binding GTPase involved in maturation of urease and hydrogenase